jgi:hypothetical protein
MSLSWRAVDASPLVFGESSAVRSWRFDGNHTVIDYPWTGRYEMILALRIHMIMGEQYVRKDTQELTLGFKIKTIPDSLQSSSAEYTRP